MAESNYRAKKAKPTIPRKKLPIQVTPWERNFRDTFRLIGVRSISNDALKFLADLMMQWVKHSSELYIFKVFLNYHNIPRKVLADWAKRCEELNEAIVITLQILATNREANALRGDPAGKAFTHLQGTYDPEWKAQEQYFNDNRIKVNNQENKTKIIVMDRFGNKEESEALEIIGE